MSYTFMLKVLKLTKEKVYRKTWIGYLAEFGYKLFTYNVEVVLAFFCKGTAVYDMINGIKKKN